MPKRSSNIMTDELKKKKKKAQGRIFICNFQFSQAEPLAEPLSDNRLQPVSAIAPPVTNIKQLLQPGNDLQRYRQEESDRKR